MTSCCVVAAEHTVFEESALCSAQRIICDDDSVLIYAICRACSSAVSPVAISDGQFSCEFLAMTLKIALPLKTQCALGQFSLFMNAMKALNQLYIQSSYFIIKDAH